MPDKGVVEMVVDRNPFSVMEINIVSFLGEDKGKGRKKHIWLPKKEVLTKAKLYVFDRLEKPVERSQWKTVWATSTIDWKLVG